MNRLRSALMLLVVLMSAVALDTQPVARVETIRRHFTPADRVSGRYQYVPFDVPAGTRVLRVDYQYDRANGENVVDLGLFEPGSLETGTTAFRGYSGGSKDSFTIEPDKATPGYRPGPLPPGTWNLLLGLYRVQDAGVEVTIHVNTAVESSPAEPITLPAPHPAPSTRPSAQSWYMGALHLHTQHSDGAVTLVEMMRLTRDAGFDFAAITDHNNTTHTWAFPPEHRGSARPLWIVGEEVTTPGGHASVWGLEPGDWIDFRVMPGSPQIAELVAAARRRGAVFSINHPASTCSGCGWEHAVVDGIEAIEISNGRHGEVQNALDIWDKLLRSGRRITAVGSSDWHGPPGPIDVANVRVQATALTKEAILASIRSGRVIVMNGARYRTPTITARVGSKTIGIGDSLSVAEDAPVSFEVKAPGLESGRVHLIANGNASSVMRLDERGQARLEQRVRHGYIRFELRAQDDSPVAYTNPIYIVHP